MPVPPPEDECTMMLHGNPLPPHYKHWVDYV